MAPLRSVALLLLVAIAAFFAAAPASALKEASRVQSRGYKYKDSYGYKGASYLLRLSFVSL